MAHFDNFSLNSTKPGDLNP